MDMIYLAKIDLWMRNFKSCPDIGLKDLFEPSWIPALIDCGKHMASYDHKSFKYMKPNVALKLGHLLKMSVELTKDYANVLDDMDTMAKCTRWLDWYASRWTRRVSSLALASQKHNSKEVPELPSEKYIRKLLNHIQDIEEKCIAAFEKNPTLTAWRQLAEGTEDANRGLG
jgi:hypothetical protein